MFDLEELNSKINQSFKNQENVEAEAQGLERKLFENYDFKKSNDYRDKLGYYRLHSAS